MNLESGEFWVRLGDRALPDDERLQAAAGRAVLAEVDAGRLNLAETADARRTRTCRRRSRRSPTPGRRARPTRSEELLHRRAERQRQHRRRRPDEADRRAGRGQRLAAGQEGRGGARRPLRARTAARGAGHGLLPRRPGRARRPSARPLATVPPARRHAATLAYMADPRDTATPRGMLGFLRKLDAGELISPASTRRLLDLAAADAARRGPHQGRPAQGRELRPQARDIGHRPGADAPPSTTSASSPCPTGAATPSRPS